MVWNLTGGLVDTCCRFNPPHSDAKHAKPSLGKGPSTLRMRALHGSDSDRGVADQGRQACISMQLRQRRTGEGRGDWTAT